MEKPWENGGFMVVSCGFMWFLWVFPWHLYGMYPLGNVYITMENHTFNWKILYKWPCSIAMLNYKRVIYKDKCARMIPY